MAMPFLKAVTTDRGINLLTRSQAGDGIIIFTKMAIGNGIYSSQEKSFEQLRSAESLRGIKNSYRLSAARREGVSNVKVTAIISNQDPITKEAVVTEGYYINEIGLFAKIEGDNEDTLLSIAVTSGEQGDYMPPFTGSETAQIVQNYIVAISNDLKINMEYSDAAVAFKEDVDRQLSDFKSEVSAKQEELSQALTKAIKDIADSKGASEVTFNPDKSITEVNSLVTITTRRNPDKSFTEHYVYTDGRTKTLKTIISGNKIITTEG